MQGLKHIIYGLWSTLSVNQVLAGVNAHDKDDYMWLVLVI